MTLLTKQFIRSLYQPRKPDSHKGEHGHALIIAGQEGKMGAAIIASRACLRSGAGLLTVLIPKSEREIIQTTVPEAMLYIPVKKKIDFSYFQSVGIGPGLSISVGSLRWLEQTLKNFKKPIVVDADALTMLSKNSRLLRTLVPDSILTPHVGEFDRLFGVHKCETERIQTAIKKSIELQIVIVLKGHKTTICRQGQVFANTTGNAGLAKGGSGDALTGIIVSFLAQGYQPLHAALLGVFLHGLASDITLKTQGMESMLITDVIENLGMAFTSLHKK